MKVKIVCSQENIDVISGLLQSNNIEIDDNSQVVIAENGFDTADDFDTKIVFRQDKIDKFIELIENIKPKSKISNMIIGIDNGTYVPLKIDDISYFNGQNNNTYAHLSNGKTYLVKSKLYQLEEDLSAKHFFRINKSELVNMKKITLITPMFKGKLVIELEGQKLPLDISRGYTKEFKERLGF